MTFFFFIFFLYNLASINALFYVHICGLLLQSHVLEISLCDLFLGHTITSGFCCFGGDFWEQIWSYSVARFMLGPSLFSCWTFRSVTNGWPLGHIALFIQEFLSVLILHFLFLVGMFSLTFQILNMIDGLSHFYYSHFYHSKLFINFLFAYCISIFMPSSYLLLKGSTLNWFFAMSCIYLGKDMFFIFNLKLTCDHFSVLPHGRFSSEGCFLLAVSCCSAGCGN